MNLKRTLQSARLGPVILAVAGILILTGTASANPTLYGAAFQGDSNPATLYSINPTTGAATMIGSIGFARVSAIGFDRQSGILYGIGFRMDGISVLITIDRTTGAGTQAVVLNPGLLGYDLSFRSDGAVFATTPNGGEPLGPALYQIDPGTGLATRLGDFEFDLPRGSALAFSPADTLYTANESRLDIVDQATAVPTLVAKLNYPNPPLNATPRANGMDFDPTTGILWASVANNFGMAASYLTTIDPATGVVTVIGQTVSGLDALAVQPELLFVSAASRMTHGSAGTFDVDLPLTGQPGVECRAGNGNYTIVFTFTNPIVEGSASLTSGQGDVSGNPTFAGNTVAVQLAGVTDAQTITVTLSKIVDNYGQTLPDAQVSVNMLIGDTNGNEMVSASDISQTKAQAGATVTSANFRADINASGTVTSADIAQVKANSGHAIP